MTTYLFNYIESGKAQSRICIDDNMLVAVARFCREKPDVEILLVTIVNEFVFNPASETSHLSP